MKKNIFISGLSLSTNNRGTQALGHGSIPFLSINEGLTTEMEIIAPTLSKNPFRNWKKRVEKEVIKINGNSYNIKYRMYWEFDVKLIMFLYRYLNIYFGFTPFGRDIKAMQFAAAICGGDGFSDIYSDVSMLNHLRWILMAKQLNKPYIILPQTIGPFNKVENYELARIVLQVARKVYVRDTAFVADLDKMGIGYVSCDDLSYYMEPMPVDIEVPANAIGINISGLCYYNSFRNLTGKFENYKLLINRIVEHYQKKSQPIYLIPHSYNFVNPEPNADDLEATKDFYNLLEDKTHVILIDGDLKSPQIKYLISKMSFFIGSRMHSCFAAIYTGTPVFGLGYSYKYEHNFSRYGLSDSFISVVDLEKEALPAAIEKIDRIQHKLSDTQVK
jgi:colanic acid/amylovoran biosynthesis protein